MLKKYFAGVLLLAAFVVVPQIGQAQTPGGGGGGGGGSCNIDLLNCQIAKLQLQIQVSQLSQKITSLLQQLQPCMQPGALYSYLTGQSCLSSANLPPSISGVSGPTVLNANQSGTWTLTASDPENGSLTYSVNWGDSSTGKGVKGLTSGINQTATFTHTYTNSGTYYPTFTVTDNANLSAQSSLSVVVGGTNNNGIPKITASPALPSTIAVGQAVNFKWQASDPDGDNLSWSGGIQDVNSGVGFAGACPSSQPNNSFSISHTWNTPGTYAVNIKVSDCKGGTDSESLMVNVASTTTQAIQVIPTVISATTLLSPDPISGLINQAAVTFKYRLSAYNGDVYISTKSDPAVNYSVAGPAVSQIIDILTASGNSSGDTQNAFEIKDGNSRDFTLQVGLSNPNGPAGIRTVKVNSLKWGTNADPSALDDNTITSGLTALSQTFNLEGSTSGGGGGGGSGTTTPPTLTPPSLKLVKPTNGVIQLAGSQKSIEWTSVNVPASNSMFMRYYNSSGSFIPTNLPLVQGPNDGVQVITVPNLAPGQYYFGLDTQNVNGVDVKEERKLVNITTGPTVSADSDSQYANALAALQGLLTSLRVQLGQQ